MKRSFILSLVCILFACMLTPVSAEEEPAASNAVLVSVEYLENGYYIETTIEDAAPPQSEITPLAEITTVTKTKTKKMKNEDGEVMWYVAITATFKYNGTSVACSDYSPSAEALASHWSICYLTSSKEKNTATAKASANYDFLWVHDTYSESVTITCSPTGVIS